MSAMNSVAIVDEFKDGLADEVSRIKARMASMIVHSIEGSAEATVPDGMALAHRYEQLASARPELPISLCTIHEGSVEDRVNAAATLLFESYD